MTVRQKMNELLLGGQGFVDCGEFKIVGRQHGFIQNSTSGEIISVYESKDDIDDLDKPVTVVYTYPTFGEFMQAFFTE